MEHREDNDNEEKDEKNSMPAPSYLSDMHIDGLSKEQLMAGLDRFTDCRLLMASNDRPWHDRPWQEMQIRVALPGCHSAWSLPGVTGVYTKGCTVHITAASPMTLISPRMSVTATHVNRADDPSCPKASRFMYLEELSAQLAKFSGSELVVDKDMSVIAVLPYNSHGYVDPLPVGVGGVVLATISRCMNTAHDFVQRFVLKACIHAHKYAGICTLCPHMCACDVQCETLKTAIEAAKAHFGYYIREEYIEKAHTYTWAAGAGLRPVTEPCPVAEPCPVEELPLTEACADSQADSPAEPRFARITGIPTDPSDPPAVQASQGRICHMVWDASSDLVSSMHLGSPHSLCSAFLPRPLYFAEDAQSEAAECGHEAPSEADDCTCQGYPG